MAARFETFKFRSRLRTQYGWRLIDSNGEKVAGGEGYVSRANANRGVRNVVETVVELTGCDKSFAIAIKEV